MSTQALAASVALCLAAAPCLAQQAANTAGEDLPEALNFDMKTLDGEPVNLAEKYKGKVVLLVNVASQCGLTPQYEALQALHAKYGKIGLAVVGVPCNQFGNQEPGGAAEIRDFCEQNYGVEFDLLAKVDVNGPDACDLYKFLTSAETNPGMDGKITWNFEKFLISRNGFVVKRFAPRVEPDSIELQGAIRRELANR